MRDELNTRTLDLAAALRRAAGILEETEEGCVALEAAFDAQTAIENFTTWYNDEDEVQS